MKKKQTVRDVPDKSYFDVLVISSNGQVLDSRTMDDEAQIFDGLLDLKVKNVNSEVHREYCSLDDNAGYRNKTVLTIEVEYDKHWLIMKCNSVV